MTPQPGQQVKITFRNAIQIEGIVESWSDTVSVLHTLTDNKIRVINKTKDDVMFYDIVSAFIQSTIKVEETPQKLQELEERFEKVYQQPSNDDLRTQSLAQLKIAIIEQEKAIISNKLKSHTSGGAQRLVKYNSPFLK